MNKYGDGLYNIIDESIANLSDREEDLLYSYIKTCHNNLKRWIINMVENESKENDENNKYFMIDNIPRIHGTQTLFEAFNIKFITDTQYLHINDIKINGSIS